jgi:hypothetical protein
VSLTTAQIVGRITRFLALGVVAVWILSLLLRDV